MEIDLKDTKNVRFIVIRALGSLILISPGMRRFEVSFSRGKFGPLDDIFTTTPFEIPLK